eukprot:760714-Hanusia_phi.AAC.8
MPEDRLKGDPEEMESSDVPERIMTDMLQDDADLGDNMLPNEDKSMIADVEHTGTPRQQILSHFLTHFES